MSGLTLSNQFRVVDCCHEGCGVVFALTVSFDDRARQTHHQWFCPNGHGQSYTGPSDATLLERAKARERALQDQLSAAIRDAETTRAALVRDRGRYAAGVCVCCNRSFDNVRRHMVTQHPEFVVEAVAQPVVYRCSCGAKFGTFRGLRTHQGHLRSDGWDAPTTSKWSAHLTVVTS